MQSFKGIMIVSGLEYVCMIDRLFGHMLPSIPKGLYIKNQLTVAVLEGLPYYTSDSLSLDKPVDVLLCEKDLYNKEGKLIAPEFMMKNKKRFFTDKPSFNPVAFNIVEDFIKSHFESHCPYYNNSKFYHNRLSTYFTKLENDYNIYDALSSFLDGLTLKLLYFMSNDYWSEYEVCVKGNDFIIYKNEDYRIIDWMTKHHSDSGENNSDILIHDGVEYSISALVEKFNAR